MKLVFTVTVLTIELQLYINWFALTYVSVLGSVMFWLNDVAPCKNPYSILLAPPKFIAELKAVQAAKKLKLIVSTVLGKEIGLLNAVQL